MIGVEPAEEQAPSAIVEKQSKRGPKAREEPVAEEPPNPRKRGRPAKDRTEDVSTDAPAEETRPRKRSKPSPAAEEPVEDDDQPVSEPNDKPRGRPSKDSGKKTEKGLRGRKEVETVVEEPAQDDDVRRSRRSNNSAEKSSKSSQRRKENRRDPSEDEDNSRSSLREVSVSQAQNRTSPPQNQQTTKGRKGKKVAEAEDADVEKETPKRQRRKGQAVDEVEDPERPEAVQKKKRGPAHRPPNATITEKAVPAAAAKKQRAEKRSTKNSDVEPTEKPQQRRKNAEPDDENEEPPAQQQQQPKEPKEKPPPIPKYRHLTTRTRQIPRSTIASKWSPLDAPSMAEVDSIIADASRPILFRLRETRSDSSRHAHAQDILATFASRLHKKLEKGMPFPPPSIPSTSKKPRDIDDETAAGPSHEAEFDFEKTVNAIQSLERTLDPLLHSVALLKREKEKEEQELERAYRRLRTLETNARTQSRGWHERAGKRDHVLAPGIRPTGPGAARSQWEEEDGEIELVKKATKEEEGMTEKGSVFKEILDDEEEDEELVKVAQQLGSHMESMRGNLEQVEGVVPAMEKTRGVLQGVLQKYLDEKQFEQVVFG